MPASARSSSPSTDRAIFPWLRNNLGATNAVLTLAIVTAILILGVFASYRFLILYDIETPRKPVGTYLLDGLPGVVEPNIIHRSINRNRADEKEKPGHHDTNKPLWMLMEASSSSLDYTQPTVLDIRSISLANYRFWLVPVDRMAPTMEVSSFTERTDGGLYIRIPGQPTAYDIVGSVHTSFPFKPKVLAWTAASGDALSSRFIKNGVAVWSVFLTLAAFSLCIAVVNHSFLYVIFSAWLISSIRVAGFNNGWDFTWLGIDQWTPSGIAIIRSTIAAYAFLTCILFVSLFNREKTGLLIHHSINFAALVFGTLIVFGHWLPMPLYLGVFRSCAAIALIMIACGVVAVIRRGNSIIAWLYAGSYFMMIAGMLLEIGFQVGVIPAIGDIGINATGGALVSAIIMSVALAAQISEERNARMHARLGELNALRELEGIYTRTPIGLFSTDLTGRLLTANPTFRQMFGLTDDQSRSIQYAILWERGLSSILVSRANQDQRDHLEFELEFDNGTGKRWFTVDFAIGEDSIDGSISDETARKTAEQRLEYLASHDPITNSLTIHSLEGEIADRLKQEKPAILGQISLNRFDFIHKIHGRQVAEKILCHVVNIIKEAMPDARIGRDHDKILFLIDSDAINLIRGLLAERFRKLRQTGLSVGNVELMPEVNAGLCLLDGDGSAAEAILRVSLACEFAQASTTQTIVVAEYNENAIIRELESTRVAGGLSDYIKAGRFFLVAQPVVDIRDHAMKPSFELLLRMRGESGEVIPPWQFIPAAERMGVMSTLDRFVVAEAFRLIRSGELELDQIDHLSINLSGSSLNDLQFLSDIYDLVSANHVDLSRLCFEITESVALNSFDRTKEFLDAIRKLGAKTAIDDFGAGHSSIHYLAELQPDYLKFDGSLTTKVLSHPVHGLFIRKMVEIAKEINVQCVAEFVETHEIEQVLVGMGVHFGQGYLYSAPMPIVDVASYCAKRTAQQILKRAGATT